MPLRIAATLSLLCFSICLLAGMFGTGNELGTVVWRGLVAMAGTFAIGLIVGLMAQKMLEENLAAESKKMAEAREARLKAMPEREPILEVNGEEPVRSHNPARSPAAG